MNEVGGEGGGEAVDPTPSVLYSPYNSYLTLTADAEERALAHFAGGGKGGGGREGGGDAGGAGGSSLSSTLTKPTPAPPGFLETAFNFVFGGGGGADGSDATSGGGGGGLWDTAAAMFGDVFGGDRDESVVVRRQLQVPGVRPSSHQTYYMAQQSATFVSPFGGGVSSSSLSSSLSSSSSYGAATASPVVLYRPLPPGKPSPPCIYMYLANAHAQPLSRLCTTTHKKSSPFPQAVCTDTRPCPWGACTGECTGCPRRAW